MKAKKGMGFKAAQKGIAKKQGVTGETAVMRIFTDMRAFRIYDGPSEVHRWSMARKLLDQKA